MEVYQPESPAARAYVPESPKKAKVELDPNTFLGKILHGMKNPVAPMRPAPFTPVLNWRTYVESLQQHMKREGWDKGDEYFTRCEATIDRIVREHENWEANHPPKPPKVFKKGYDVPDTIDYVRVHFTFTKNGKVKVRMNVPMAEIYEKYHSKGVRAPTPVYIRALRDFGYPDEVLEKVLLKAQNAPKLKAEMEALIERVFGNTGTSKPSKPKRGTITQEITKRMKNLNK